MAISYMNQRRLRASTHVRDLSATVSISHRDMIQPIFVAEGLSERVSSPSMSGVFTETENTVLTQIAADIAAGVQKFLFFPIPTGRFETDFDFGFAQKIVQSSRTY